MGRGLSAESVQLIQRAYEVLAVEHPSGIRRVAYALFGNAAEDHVKKLGRLLTRARKMGVIPWEWINDSTRTEILPFVVEDMSGLRATNRACPSYDPWLHQPVRVKVWSEKSVGGTLEPVLGPGDLPELHVSVTGSFRLKETLDLEGPAGPWPAADTVVLVMDFVMRPKR